MNKINSSIRFLVAILGCLLIGFIGAFFTMPSIPTWYTALNKPAFNPPNWIFGPVWTALYILMGLAVFCVWEKGWEKHEVKQALTVFIIQLILNLLWSLIFFSWHLPAMAFGEIIILWAAIFLTIIYFWRVSKTAGILLLPYIVWVSFAAFLNFTIMKLNS